MCLVRADEKQFTRSIASFCPSTSTYVAEFDSSLSGIGVIWSRVTDGAEVILGVCAFPIGFLSFRDDSSYQNLAEFLGALIAIVGFTRMNFQGHALKLRGDSITALTWAITERPRGELVTKAAMAWTLVSIASGVHIADVEHIPGVQNDKCDCLSRRSQGTELSVKDELVHMGLAGVHVLHLENDTAVQELLRCCDPNVPVSTDEMFMSFWGGMRETVTSALRSLPSDAPPSAV